MTSEWKERLTLAPVTIGILGPIGVGKSTLSGLLSRELELTNVEENFPLNPFLAKFYDDPKSWSFKSQVWFLEQKISQLAGLNPAGSYLIDPALEMDAIYAKTLTHIGYMDEGEYGVYEKLFQTLVKEKRIKKPDLYLRMGASLDVIKQRIVKRGRAFEMKMVESYPFYLTELSGGVRDFATSQKSSNVIYVDATRDDFLTEGNLGELVNKIKTILNEH